ncbi:unnamed protein product [Rhizophagus irregularis]|nr:unnamed protein product [Rhizophagus irregularis]
MNEEEYKNLLTNNPKDLKYENINEVLYRVKNGKKLKVIKDHEYEGLMDRFCWTIPSTKRRNRYILVAMDYFTKWPEAKATKRDTAEEVVKFLYEEIICRHGCPQR